MLSVSKRKLEISSDECELSNRIEKINSEKLS